MDTLRSCAGHFLHKYQYVLIVAAAGVLLLLWPSCEASVKDGATAETALRWTETSDTERKLAQLLSRIEGVGQAEIMLTVDSSGKRVVAKDSSRSEDRRYGDSGLVTDSGESASESVVILDAADGDSALVLAENAPGYRGALVVCQGADSPTVCLAVTRAVADLTGLSSDHISVVKMAE